MSHYIISVGHTASGNIGCGAVGNIDESNCTREIAPLVRDILIEQGHTVTFLQVDKGNTYNCEDCYTRANQANNAGGDLFVEIHINAGGGRGSEVCVCKGASQSTRAIAGRVSNSLATTLGLPDRGVKEESLIVLNKTSMPAILVECLFCDSSDTQVYNASKIATAIVEGLLGIKLSVGSGVWSKNTNGEWSYYNKDGSKYTGWLKYDDHWYYLDTNGVMKTGWIQSKDKWYYLWSNGEMATGWIKPDGKTWYYLADNGEMKTGWLKDKDEWYYLNRNGSMATGWIIVDNKKYYLYSNGTMAHGVTLEGNYVMGADGALIK